MSNAVCWNCGKTGHWWRDCSEWWWSRGKGKGRVQGDEHADGWWKANKWQSSRLWKSANGETAWEEPIGGILEIGGIEGCDSKSLRRGTEQRMRRWQRPRREEGARDQEATHCSSTTVKMNAQIKKRQPVIRSTPTERRIVVPPEVPHDTRICTEDLDFDESDSDREMQDEVRRWNVQTEATWVKEASKLLKRDFQGLRMESEDDPDGEALTLNEWRQLCVERDRLQDALEDETESSSSAYDESFAENECKGTDIDGETSYQEPSKKRALNAHHLFAGGRQVHFDDTMQVCTIGNWKQALEEFEDESNCENSSDGSETSGERCTVACIASTAKATKTRPDEHWNCVVGTARLFQVSRARQQA